MGVPQTFSAAKWAYDNGPAAAAGAALAALLIYFTFNVTYDDPNGPLGPRSPSAQCSLLGQDLAVDTPAGLVGEAAKADARGRCAVTFIKDPALDLFVAAILFGAAAAAAAIKQAVSPAPAAPP